MLFTREQFGRIKIIPGQRGARFPYCNSLFIDDEVKVLIDPGAGPRALAESVTPEEIEVVFNTHYHFDHIAYNHLFQEAQVWINEKEAECFRDQREIVKRLGMWDSYGNEWTEEWVKSIKQADTPQSPFSPAYRQEWWLSTCRLDREYRWGETLDFGRTKMQIIGAPGHTTGFNCLLFPEERMAYVSDIDLTDFGPWYGGNDGDIDQFIDSAWTIASLEADYFLTGHEMGLVEKAEFIRLLDSFLNKIKQRDEKILRCLERPASLKELAGMGIIYDRQFLVDVFVKVWEENTIKKHLLRMLERGEVNLEGEIYFKP